MLDLIKMNPTSNGLRHVNKIQKYLLVRNSKLFRHFLLKYSRKNGRSFGKIITRHKGGGHKRLYRPLTDVKEGDKVVVIGTTYDPNRTCFVNICFNCTNNTFFFSLAGEHVGFGAYYTFLKKNEKNFVVGNRSVLENLPSGSIIFNVTSTSNGLGKIALAAGTSAILVSVKKNLATLKLPSGKFIKLDASNKATIGSASNKKNYLIIKGKAGVNRRCGIRPSVRGIAMNPVDHPHGGRTNGGKPSVTPWGWPTKGGFKLRKRKN